MPNKVPSSTEILSGKKKSDKKPDGKKRKHSFGRTVIEHHNQGGHKVSHIPDEGGPEVNYSAADLDAVHDGLEEHVGEPNKDEEAA